MISGFFRSKGGLSLVLALIGLLWLGAIRLRAFDRYVVEPGTIAGGNDGIYTNWDIAATQIQWAVDVATNAGDTIWVSNGLYVLTNQILITNAIRLQSTNGSDVTIVNGGFVFGVENATSNNRCLYLSNTAAFVSGFTFSNGACTNFGGAGVAAVKGTLSNCTICNNTLFQPKTNTSAPLYFGGGGIIAYLSSTVTTCRIIGNTITNPATIISGGTAGAGGGLYCSEYAVNCLISNNVIYGGGGIYGGAYGAGVYLNGTMHSSLICNNSNQIGYAGGIDMDVATMVGCTVAVNWASDVGGCYLIRGTVTNCVISNNIGRGVYLTPNTVSAIPTVKNTTIVGNTKDGVYMSGAIGTTIVSDCVIAGNMSNGVTMYHVGTNKYLLNSVIRNNRRGGVKCEYPGVIRNCLIAGNTNAGNWGGLVIESLAGTTYVNSCTIASNQSTTGTGAGIRIEVPSASPLSVSSCIIYSNGMGGTNDVFDACAPTNYNAIQYSCVGTNPGFTGAVIIVADPQFKNFDGENLRLAGNSPCINRGSNEPWMTNAYDLDKNQRIRYGTVDMGAYERINEGVIYTVH